MRRTLAASSTVRTSGRAPTSRASHIDRLRLEEVVRGAVEMLCKAGEHLGRGRRQAAFVVRDRVDCPPDAEREDCACELCFSTKPAKSLARERTAYWHGEKQSS